MQLRKPNLFPRPKTCSAFVLATIAKSQVGPKSSSTFRNWPLPIEQFKLPVRDVVDGLPRTDFYVPGSIVRIELDSSNPITAGMAKESIAWAENSPVFEVLNTGSAGVPPAMSAQREKQRTADGTSALPVNE